MVIALLWRKWKGVSTLMVAEVKQGYGWFQYVMWAITLIFLVFITLVIIYAQGRQSGASRIDTTAVQNQRHQEQGMVER